MTACSIHDCVEANCPSSRGSWSGTWWSVAACDPSSACPLRPSAWWWCYRPTESGVWWPRRIPTDRYHLDISRRLDINSHHSDINSSLRYQQSILMWCIMSICIYFVFIYFLFFLIGSEIDVSPSLTAKVDWALSYLLFHWLI